MGIQSKDNHLPIKSRHSNLNTDTMVVTKTREEFIVWIRLAINDRECGAYEELYQFLTSCFVRADTDKQFKEMDTKGAGYITLNQWIRFAIDHIMKKYVQLPKDYLSASAADVSKEEFIAFIKKAVDT